MNLRVLLHEALAAGAVTFCGRSVIVEPLDRHPLRELGKPADVIAVIVRQHEVIDLLHARVFERQHDAIGIAPSRIADVDEQRLTGRSHEQRCLAAFRVDVIDLQRFRGRLRRCRRAQSHTAASNSPNSARIVRLLK